MRRIPIRTKLAAALLVPLVGLVSVTVVEVAGTTAHRGDVRAQTELARASVGPGGVITSLQNERAWTVIELVGQQDVIHPPVVGYQEVRRATDEAIAAFRQALEGDPVAREYGAALRGLSGLAGLRQQVDANTAPRDPTNRDSSNQVFAAYTELVTPFLDANDRVALRIDDAELRQLSSLVDTATRQLEIQAALARATIRASAREAGTDRREEIAGLARLRSRFADGNAELMAAPPPFDQVVRQHYPGRLVEDLSVEVERALAGEPVRTENLLGALDVPADGGYRGVRNALVDRLMARADDLNDAAGARQRSYLTVAGLTLAAALLLTWMVSRSITRPLRALTRQAKDMADHRLPDAVIDILQTPLGQDIAVPRVDPVRVPAHDEVADVADALNTVQETALDLAVEQAVLRRNIADSFVNLGRRNQNLLGRQLDFITELESNETDPDTLANLFRLDHLATRMRRNAESLLVLAGIDPPRKWAAPVRLTDVIRAALSEVEDYQRVIVRSVEPATIMGSAAADLAHLLAELIENALAFSPPDQPVDIRGRANPDGYTLAIIDSGLGMPPPDIAAANRRLAGAESFTIAPSKYLGHYVAGNLAARHGIRVTLANAPDAGIAATVAVPADLLTDDEARGAPVTPPHGHHAPAPTGAAARPRPAAPPAPLAPRSPSLEVAPDEPPGAGPAAEERSGRDDTRTLAPTAGGRALPAPSASGPGAGDASPVPPTDGAPPRSPTGPAPRTAPAPPPRPGGGGPRTTRVPDTRLGRTPGGLVRRVPVVSDRPPPEPARDRAVVASLARYVPDRPPVGPGPDGPIPPPSPGTDPAGGGDRPATGPAPEPAVAVAATMAPGIGGVPPLPARVRPDGPPRTAGPGRLGAGTGGVEPVGVEPGDAGPARAPMPAGAGVLARRVPGAQLPQAGLVPLRRGGGEPSGPLPVPAGGQPGPAVATSTAADRASEVYALLSDFTAGVQRGLTANVPRRRTPPPRDGVGGPTEALPSGAPDDQA